VKGRRRVRLRGGGGKKKAIRGVCHSMEKLENSEEKRDKVSQKSFCGRDNGEKEKKKKGIYSGKRTDVYVIRIFVGVSDKRFGDGDRRVLGRTNLRSPQRSLLASLEEKSNRREPIQRESQNPKPNHRR